MLTALVVSFFFRRQNKNKPAYLIIDEAHIISDRSLEILLSQCRKRGLFVVLATQDIRQFSKTIKEHLQTNVGLRLSSTIDLPSYSNKKYHFLVQHHNHDKYVIKSPKWVLQTNHS